MQERDHVIFMTSSFIIYPHIFYDFYGNKSLTLGAGLSFCLILARVPDLVIIKLIERSVSKSPLTVYQ